jgi:hypothetical protein
MATPAVTPATGASSTASNKRRFIAHITRDQGPEFEQTVPMSNTTSVTTPTSLRTDRKITHVLLFCKGRLTNGAAAVTYATGPALLTPGPPGTTSTGAAIFRLIQQFDIRGQHARYGALTPILMRGESQAEWDALLQPNYIPYWDISINGATPVPYGPWGTAAAATNDFRFILPIPLFPLGINPSEQSFYALHGPDWPGNLFVDITFADATALGVALASLANGGAITAYGSASGSGSCDILTERPLVGKDMASNIRPAITFRTSVFQQPTAVVQAGGAAGSDLADLIVGKDTTRILLKTGTQLGSTSAGVTAFASYSDSIVTNFFFSLDSRGLRFQGANRDAALFDYMSRGTNRLHAAGYALIDFTENRYWGSANAKACLPSSKYTAARKLQANGDTVSASNQIAEITQELLFGRSGLNKSAGVPTTSSSTSTTTGAGS